MWASVSMGERDFGRRIMGTYRISLSMEHRSPDREDVRVHFHNLAEPAFFRCSDLSLPIPTAVALHEMLSELIERIQHQNVNPSYYRPSQKNIVVESEGKKLTIKATTLGINCDVTEP